VPVTVRQLEAIIRISESLAKMQLQVRGAGGGGWCVRVRVPCQGEAVKYCGAVGRHHLHQQEPGQGAAASWAARWG